MRPQLRELAGLGLLALVAGCANAPQARRAVPSYDDYTGRLIQLNADQNLAWLGNIDRGVDILAQQ